MPNHPWSPHPLPQVHQIHPPKRGSSIFVTRPYISTTVKIFGHMGIRKNLEKAKWVKQNSSEYRGVSKRCRYQNWGFCGCPHPQLLPFSKIHFLIIYSFCTCIAIPFGFISQGKPLSLFVGTFWFVLICIHTSLAP